MTFTEAISSVFKGGIWRWGFIVEIRRITFGIVITESDGLLSPMWDYETKFWPADESLPRGCWDIHLGPFHFQWR